MTAVVAPVLVKSAPENGALATGFRPGPPQFAVPTMVVNDSVENPCGWVVVVVDDGGVVDPVVLVDDGIVDMLVEVDSNTVLDVLVVPGRLPVINVLLVVVVVLVTGHGVVRGRHLKTI